MAAEWGVNAAEMVAFQIGEIQVLQARSTEGTVGREENLLALGIVDEGAPFAVGIDLDNLMSRRHFALSDERRQRDEERPVGGKGHPIRQRGKPF